MSYGNTTYKVWSKNFSDIFEKIRFSVSIYLDRLIRQY